ETHGSIAAIGVRLSDRRRVASSLSETDPRSLIPDSLLRFAQRPDDFPDRLAVEIDDRAHQVIAGRETADVEAAERNPHVFHAARTRTDLGLRRGERRPFGRGDDV